MRMMMMTHLLVLMISEWLRANSFLQALMKESYILALKNKIKVN